MLSSCPCLQVENENVHTNATLSKKDVKENKGNQENEGKQANQENHKKTFGFYSREGV